MLPLKTPVCSCVRLNKTIQIFTMTQQEQANRNGLQLGLVSETHSADLKCPKCFGTGVDE